MMAATPTTTLETTREHFATKAEVAERIGKLLEKIGELRGELRHTVTKGDLYRALFLSVLAIVGANASLTFLIVKAAIPSAG